MVATPHQHLSQQALSVTQAQVLSLLIAASNVQLIYKVQLLTLP